jgi:hypothetical protein
LTIPAIERKFKNTSLSGLYDDSILCLIKFHVASFSFQVKEIKAGQKGCGSLATKSGNLKPSTRNLKLILSWGKGLPEDELVVSYSVIIQNSGLFLVSMLPVESSRGLIRWFGRSLDEEKPGTATS